MARLIQKSGYFKGGSTGYMKYIAQRDGVEITSDTGPVTEKQRQHLFVKSCGKKLSVTVRPQEESPVLPLFW